MPRSHSPAVPSSLDDEPPLTDEEIALGFYTTRELIERGIVKDRQDLRRKQLKYGFPRPTKTGDRQAPTSKARVFQWIRRRAALSHQQEQQQQS